MDRQLPYVTVLLPVFNEAQTIDSVLSDLVGQDYEGQLEIVVADGGSTDSTPQILEQWSGDARVSVIANPDRRQAYGLNRAAAMAGGAVLIRADGHTRYAADYVSASIRVLEETGGAVGGRMNPVGTSRTGRAIAAAMDSPLTMGPGRFHHASTREAVDTVYLGAFSREGFEDIGGFRSFPSGSSEDADFYYRWRQTGRRVFVDPAIRSEYTPRDSFRGLWRQYWRYGRGKTEMLWVNGRLPSLRPLAPIAFVVALATFGALWGLGGSLVPLGAVLAGWAVAIGSVGVRARESPLRVAGVAAIMHVSYGLGAIFGLIKGPSFVRRL